MRFAWIVPAVGSAALLAFQGCVHGPAPAVRAGDLERTKSLLLNSLSRYVNPTPLHENYVQALVGTFDVSSVGRNGAEEMLTIAWLKPKGWYCSFGVKTAGMEAPEELADKSEATRLVALDGRSHPLYQISITPWTEMALIDADHDPTTTELILWSERIEFSDPAFLKIFRLTPEGCRPLLELILNPRAMRTRFETTQTREGDRTVFSGRTIHEPERRGRWRFEGNAILIEELKREAYGTVARFEFDPTSQVWRGPAGGDQELWKVGGDPWIQAEFLAFGDLEPGRKLKGAGFGSLRKDADHRKAAEEAVREAGLR